MFSQSTSSQPAVNLTFESLPTVSLKVNFFLYSDYRVNVFCWIKEFAAFTNGLQTYFLRTSRVTGCIYFHTPRQTSPNRSHH